MKCVRSIDVFFVLVAMIFYFSISTLRFPLKTGVESQLNHVNQRIFYANNHRGYTIFFYDGAGERGVLGKGIFLGGNCLSTVATVATVWQR